ncbi:MAG: efflux transporter outer membrane subunit [Synergistes sp.]|nr:efflux transporter outer membrane subunit [Synergistes sp.]
MRRFILCFAVLLLTAASLGCAHADDKTPPTSTDELIKEGAWAELARLYPNSVTSDDKSAITPEELASWWDIFEDPLLTELIEKTLSGNKDVASARAKVTEARAALGVSRAALLPWLDSTDFWSNSRTPAEAGGAGSSVKLARLGIDASWEIDLFGGTRARVKAQEATLEAQYAELYSVWTGLAAETALEYISLRTLQERLAIAQYNLYIQQDTTDIEQSKVDSGLTDELSLQQAEYTMDQTKAAIPVIEAQIEQTKNALAILVGEAPGALDERLSSKTPIPQINRIALIGIPANQLRRRPDIIHAERQLAAQLSRKKAARADLWPKFYLTGSIGTESLDWSGLFKGPAKLYSFMPQIVWPIFHAGAIRNNIKAQDAKAEQLLALYEKTVLQAAGEVRDSLAANIKEYERLEALRSGVKAAGIALDLSMEKYSNGLVDFLNVINAQRDMAAISDLYAISMGNTAANAVQLFNALGGGWKPMEEAEQALAAAEKEKKKKQN